MYATLRGGGIDLLGRLFESQLVAKLTVTYLLLSKLKHARMDEKGFDNIFQATVVSRVS